MENPLSPDPATITVTAADRLKEILNPKWLTSLYRGATAELLKQQQQLAVPASSVTNSSKITNNQRMLIEVRCEGHRYGSAIAAGDSRQINGDMGFENGGRSPGNLYEEPKATEKCIQVNGNLSENVAKEIFKK